MSVFKICDGCLLQRDDPALQCSSDDCQKYGPSRKPSVEQQLSTANAQISTLEREIAELKQQAFSDSWDKYPDTMGR